MTAGTIAQRLRIVFSKGAEVKYISHLDVLRAWERALRRADAPLAFSQGFNPHVLLYFAAALPVGVTGSAEILDVMLESTVDPASLLMALSAVLPIGLSVTTAYIVPVDAPNLAGQITSAEYIAEIEALHTPNDVQERIDAFLSREQVPRHIQRKDKSRDYDLRPLVQGLRFGGRRGERYLIGMRLQASARGTGRPDEVLDALGLRETVVCIERVSLHTDDG